MLHKDFKTHNSIAELVMLVVFGIQVFTLGLVTVSIGFSLENLANAQSDWYVPTQKQGTIDFITATPTPIPQPTQPLQTPIPNQSPAPTQPPQGPIISGPLPTGGAVPPDAPVYCIDDEDPDGCDDQTAFHVPKGVGGPSGSCGTIMEQAHKLVNSLPQYLKGDRDSLNPAVSSNCGSTGPYSAPDYISTFFVIDAYNLAGYNELSKSNASHVLGANLLNWWKGNPAGYKFIPYSPTVIQQHAGGQQDLTGCVMFLDMGGGKVHPGIFNVLQQVNQNGDGVVSILQSGARYFLDRFIVAGWAIQNTPQHQTVISGIAGFGCKQ